MSGDVIHIANWFEKVDYGFLIALLILVLTASIIDLISIMFQYLFVQTAGLLESYEIITILGAFLLVLIGAELLETVKAYFKENLIHVEIVILFAIIAISRKIILIESKGMTGFEFALGLMGYGLIVICLGSGYLLVKKSGIAARERIPESPE